MTKKWNLQDIRPAEPRKSRAPRMINQDQNNLEPDTPPPQTLREREQIPSIVIEDGTKKGRKRLLTSVVIFVVIVGGALALSALLGKTVLTIHPINKEPNVSAEFTAYPDKQEDALSYEILTLESTGESQVKASGQVQVDKQTTGVIEIIKTTPGSERLIKNTRFRSKDGLIFRIQESVVVPGAVTSGDGSLVPGTIQIGVFADETGDKYNLSAGNTFDIPGFEESGFTELYQAISARNPSAFTGGFSGMQFQIDENELSSARQALQSKLREELMMRVKSEKPADYIAFDDSVAITYNQLPAEKHGEDMATIREQAILQVPLFKRIDFGSFLARETITTYDGEPVRVENPSALTFRYTSATTSASVIANEPSLTFKLTGKPLLVWEYDGEGLAKNLATLPKTAITNAIEAYPGIKEARAHITPFWKQSFPDNPEEIILVEEIKPEE